MKYFKKDLAILLSAATLLSSTVTGPDVLFATETSEAVDVTGSTESSTSAETGEVSTSKSTEATSDSTEAVDSNSTDATDSTKTADSTEATASTEGTDSTETTDSTEGTDSGSTEVSDSTEATDFASAEEVVEEVVEEDSSDEVISRQTTQANYIITPINNKIGNDATYNITYGGSLLKSCYVALAKTTETAAETEAETTQKTEDPVSTYEGIDPAKSAKYEDMIIVHCDKTGCGVVDTATKRINITYNGEKTLYYVYQGKIRTADKTYYAIYDNTAYRCKKNGQATAFTGYFKNFSNNKYYFANASHKIVKSKYVLATYEKIDGYPTYTVIDPSQAANYPNATIYYANKSGYASKYKGSRVGGIYTGGDTDYYIYEGAVATGTSTRYAIHNNTAYKVAKNGVATAYTGYFKNMLDGKYYFALSNHTILKDQYVMVTKATTSGIGKYQIVDPSKSSEYSSPMIFRLNSTGVSSKYTGTRIGTIYNGSDASYYIYKGQIKSGNAISFAIYNDVAYMVSKIGVASAFTGYFKNHVDDKYYFAIDGEIKKGKYIMAVKTTSKGIPTYKVISPSKASSNKSAVIYRMNSSGIASVYKGTTVLTITYGANTYTYSVENGKVKTYSSSQNFVSNSKYLFTANQTGKATKYSGVYKNYYYYNGRKKTTSASYYVYYKGYIYKANASGKLTKYKKPNTTNEYYSLVWGNNGKQYFVSVNPKNAKATIIKKNPDKSGYWYKKSDGALLQISYSTGQARVFTGVYKSKYYQDGKVRTASGSYYRVYNNYLYRMTKDGAATKYIRNKNKSTTYFKYVDGNCYYVYYNTGKIKEKLTSTQARQRLVDKAAIYLGIDEGSREHKNIVDTYNAATSGYNVTYTDSWCATFVSAMFIMCGYTAVTALECSCGRQVALWQEMGVWIENDAYVPKTGDIIYYCWSDMGKGDCTKWPNHVGIVVSCEDGMITVIEGNYGDSVGYRKIAVDARYIRGFASPNY